MAGVASAVLAATLVVYALVVEPVWGWWYMRRLRRRVRVMTTRGSMATG